MNRIQRLEKQCEDLYVEYTRLVEAATVISNKRGDMHQKFHLAIRRLIRPRLKKGDAVYVPDGDRKYTVIETQVGSVLCSRSFSEYEYNISYDIIIAVRRKGRIVYKNREWIGK